MLTPPTLIATPAYDDLVWWCADRNTRALWFVFGLALGTVLPNIIFWFNTMQAFAGTNTAKRMPPGLAALSTVLTGASENASNVMEIPARKVELGDRECRNHSFDHFATFPCELYRVKSTPAVIPGGSVFVDTTSDNFPWFVFGGRECTGPFCSTTETTRYVEGDIIAVYISHHYFHFMYETVLRLYPLFLHGLFERYRNATVLCYSKVPIETNFEFLETLGFDFPRNNFVQAERDVVYRVHAESTLIVPRFNDYHSGPRFKPYNIRLLQSLRHRFVKMVEDPPDKLFVSRKGYRRCIEKEDELFQSLKAWIPELRQVLPNDYSDYYVAEQAHIFANAKLIIAPYGASLTNVVFSNWQKLVLIEFTQRNNGFVSYRNDAR